MADELSIPQDRLAVSPGEGARIIGISRTKFYDLVKSGELSLVKLGTRSLVRVSDLKRLIGEVAA